MSRERDQQTQRFEDGIVRQFLGEVEPVGEEPAIVDEWPEDTASRDIKPPFNRYKLGLAMFFVKHDRIEEAIGCYDELIKDYAGDDVLVGGLWIHRAHANLEQEAYGDAYNDLSQAKALFARHEGNAPADLTITLDLLARRLPKNMAGMLLAPSSKSEGVTEAKAESNAGRAKAVLQRLRLLPKPAASQPPAQPAGTLQS